MSAGVMRFTAGDVVNVLNRPRARIDVYSHGIRISRFNGEVLAVLLGMIREHLSEYAIVPGRFGRGKRKIVKAYVGANRDRTVFHFHRNNLDLVMSVFRRINVKEDRLEIVKHDLFTPPEIIHPLNDPRPPRETQLPILKYLMEPCKEGMAPSKVVTLQTGGGKTFIGLTALRSLKVRGVFVLKGMYIEKWIEDIEGAYGKEKDALVVIRGMPQLLKLIGLAEAGLLKARVIIISNKTMFMYLKAYEQYGLKAVGNVPPWKLYETLGVGVRFIDEVHQDFHCNFRQDLYTHVPMTISLSATLKADNKHTQDMYYVTWPAGTWAPEIPFNKYINAWNLWYKFSDDSKLVWANKMGQYNHTELEKSIIRQPKLKAKYYEMIADLVQRTFVDKREPGQKMFVYVATVYMATELQNYLQGLHPRLAVHRYVSEDDYEELQTGDISVTTLLSAGTAVDVPNLRVTLMTTALSTTQGNLQVLGRTRPLVDWPKVEPDFYFLSCLNIDKHINYAKEKRVQFKGKVLTFNEHNTGWIL